MTYTLMIVEDEDIVQEGLERAVPWAELGFRLVASASSGEEALALYGSYQPDVILTDIKMYEVSGLDVLKQVKQQQPACEVVLLSGYEDFNYAKQGLEHGAYAYVLKLNWYDELPEVFRKLRLDLAKKKENMQLLRSATRTAASEQLSARMRGQGKAPDLQSAYSAVALILCEGVLATDELRTAAGPRIQSALVEMAPHTQLLLLETDGAPEELELACQKTVYRLQQWQRSRARGEPPLYAGWGEVTGSGEVERSYEQACKMLDLARLRQQDTPLRYAAQLPSLTGGELALELGPVERCIDLTLMERLREELWRLLTEAMERRHVHYREIHAFCLDVLILLLRRHDTLQPMEKPNLGDALQQLSRMDSVYDIRSWFDELLERLAVPNPSASDGTQRIQRALAYIDEHYAKDLNMTEVARMSFMSASYFSIQFKSHVGQTFTDYLIHKRLQKAMDLLVHTKARVADISKSVGYEDEKYFARIFKKRTGLTAQQYREQAEEVIKK